MKLRIKRVKQPWEPTYMSFAKRCQFAVETVRSLAVPTPEQCTELELMFLERDENEKND